MTNQQMETNLSAAAVAELGRYIASRIPAVGTTKPPSEYDRLNDAVEEARAWVRFDNDIALFVTELTKRQPDQGAGMDATLRPIREMLGQEIARVQARVQGFKEFCRQTGRSQ